MSLIVIKFNISLGSRRAILFVLELLNSLLIIILAQEVCFCKCRELASVSASVSQQYRPGYAGH